MFYRNSNERDRQAWLKKTLLALPRGARILDAGAGELRNKPLCAHLDYVSQDFCRYEGRGDGHGLQTGQWNTARVDLVCDIAAVPEPARSFDAVLCSEVLEHVPDPGRALDEFVRLLKPGGTMILTAPFASLVHFAPYHFYSGFSRYWYEYHLGRRGMEITELAANGDWFSMCRQEMMRLRNVARQYGDWRWPLTYFLDIWGAVYFGLRGGRRADDLACFGWHCVAVKKG